MLVHREHLLGLFVLLLTFYRKGALFSIPFGFYWIINTPDILLLIISLFILFFQIKNKKIDLKGLFISHFAP
ncbi:hypothetical protein AA906_14915 [Geobacillus stearothermophilus]|nr:hypothetical protein AA906_14915 [Geobacillus stearothermophilus]